MYHLVITRFICARAQAGSIGTDLLSIKDRGSRQSNERSEASVASGGLGSV